RRAGGRGRTAAPPLPGGDAGRARGRLGQARGLRQSQRLEFVTLYGFVWRLRKPRMCIRSLDPKVPDEMSRSPWTSWRTRQGCRISPIWTRCRTSWRSIGTGRRSERARGGCRWDFLPIRPAATMEFPSQIAWLHGATGRKGRPYMVVHLSADLERLVQSKVESGHYRSADEVISEALLAL